MDLQGEYRSPFSCSAFSYFEIDFRIRIDTLVVRFSVGIDEITCTSRVDSPVTRKVKFSCGS